MLSYDEIKNKTKGMITISEIMNLYPNRWSQRAPLIALLKRNGIEPKLVLNIPFKTSFYDKKEVLDFLNKKYGGK